MSQTVTPRKPVSSITRHVGKVMDIESIGLDGFHTYLAVNLAELKYEDDAKSYPYICLAVECAPKPQTKGPVKMRVNLTPNTTLTHAAQCLRAYMNITGKNQRETLSELAMEVGP